MNRTRVLAGLLGLVAAIPVGLFLKFASNTCVATWMKWDVELAECPDGDSHVIANLYADNVRRGAKSSVGVQASALYVVHDALDVRQVQMPELDVEMSLVRGETVTPLELRLPDVDGKPAKGKPKSGFGFIELPGDLPDGDYVLRAKVKTKAGDAVVDAPLPLYAPAKIHVITDRPLYEPGHTVKMRAVVLRARDLVPLEKRPGKWVVLDARGTTVLEEKVDAAEYGIVEGEVPLDKSSPVGVWHVRYESGGVVEDVGIEVKPFELPRFTVSVEPTKPFYGAKDEPRVNVKVATAAGVPIVTDLDVEWFVNSSTGAGALGWPAPPEWTAALPKKARTDKSGRAELTVPKVPADLQGKVYIACRVTARDDTGDQEVGQGTVLLAEDAIDVSLVTELGTFAEPGLVEGINNRAYLRATTPAGMALVGATLTVQRTWDKSDKGVVVETDEDGVAAMQIDPGAAVNIVIPPLPVRLPPPPPLVERTGLSDTLGDGDVPLGVVAAMDRLNPVVAPCARFTQEGTEAQLALRVEGSGRIARASASGPLAECIGDALMGRSLPPGPPRILDVSYAFAPRLASLLYDVQGIGALPARVSGDLEVAVMDARECLGPLTVDAALPRVFSWEVYRGTFTGSWGRDPDPVESLLADGKTSCVEARVGRALRTRDLIGRAAREELALQEVDEEDDGTGGTAFGVVRFSVGALTIDGAPVGPQATTMLGYELLVSAKSGDEAVGKTKVRIRPGVIPSIRLRASEPITEPGATVTIDILRGPTFEGELPKKLALTHPELGVPLESDVDEKTRQAKFTLPKDKDGWYEARFGEGLARIFVPRRTALSVEVAPDKQSYKPGETAKLAVTTRGAGTGADGKSKPRGVSAAVGLIGVDDTLSQIASLPGAGDMDRLTTTVTMHSAAFNVLDATALSLGRVRGKNAAAATVLLVSSVPTPVELDVSATAQGQTPFDPAAPLADRFYTVLEDLYSVVRGFEAKAPKDEKLTPQKMLALWDDALASAKKRGKETTDVFGRPMKLELLPEELIALTDPRLVVADGTRLPEDIEAWTRFVKNNGGKS